MTYDEHMAIAAREYLRGVLQHTRGKVAAAARLAGMNRQNFYKVCRRHGVSADEFRRARERAVLREIQEWHRSLPP